MVVDDSAVIRGFITRYLEEDPAIKVVATAANGLMAVRTLARARPDVVVLDIEMPEMDGLTALPKLLEQDRTVKVVMASTLTRKNAEVSMRSLQLGASDYVPKPESLRAVNASIDFRRELVEKVKVYAAQRRRILGLPQPQAGGHPIPGVTGARGPAKPTARGATVVTARRTPVSQPPVVAARAKSGATLPSGEAAEGGARIVLRRPSPLVPEILAVASSTGGPQALMKLFSGIEKERLKRVPIAVVQHMPATFTAILAQHLERAAGIPAVEGEDGMPFEQGRIHVAPGDYHMVLEKEKGGIVVRLNQDPPENFCRPAADPMFRSVARIYGGKALAVVLTGMGHDGLRGARELVSAGGTLIAQDEETSVVWGMPGAVATAGLCSSVLPLDQMGAKVAKFLGGGR
ncbi:MAG: chemotaxis response regulator protein-glutamate methylesterase [Alphaproteobacteria bacterium]|nr:MAG: chemotaxis response regulator protein-glutamate methylesterase [Alphaproteobacteria bacterium]